jgi:3-oxoacyl-[acyl-carrier-protein] synthase-3
MSKIKAAITGIEAWVPEYVLTNHELSTMVDTNDAWIVERTGIRERHILKGEGLATSDLAVPAVKKLLEKTNTKPEEVEVIVFGTVTPDSPVPSTANILADKLGIKNGFGFDVNAACCGFLYALTIGARLIESGAHKKVIVVGADKMSSIVDYTDRNTCILFGDGAGAVMLEPSTEFGIEDSVLYSDGEGRNFLGLKAGGSLYPASHETVEQRQHYLHQSGSIVFKSAVKGMSGAIEEILKRNNLAPEDIAWVVPHQANIRILQSVAEYANIPMDKVMINIQKYGNTTAATIPLCLWEWQDQLKKGDKLLLTAFGGGFTWGCTYLTWAI